MIAKNQLLYFGENLALLATVTTTSNFNANKNSILVLSPGEAIRFKSFDINTCFKYSSVRIAYEIANSIKFVVFTLLLSG